MTWNITDSKRADRPTTIDELRAEYPELVAYDESGFEVDPDDFRDDPLALLDAGYGDPSTRRILFWSTEEDSENCPGLRAIACAEWDGSIPSPIRADELPEWFREEFVEAFYFQWEDEYLGEGPDTDSPAPWGMPWYYDGNVPLRGGSVEEMARTYYESVREEIRKAIKIEFIELGNGELEDVIKLIPASGEWIIIRDDDAAQVGASAYWAAQGETEAVEAAYEESGGTVSATIPVAV